MKNYLWTNVHRVSGAPAQWGAKLFGAFISRFSNAFYYDLKNVMCCLEHGKM